MRKLAAVAATLATAVVVAFVPATARGASCAAWFAPEPLGGLRISGWAEMQQPSRAWIVDLEGKLLQDMVIRFDPVQTTTPEPGIGPPLVGVFSERATFAVEPEAPYRALIVAPTGTVGCVAWFAAPAVATLCKASFVPLHEGGWMIAGTTRAPGAETVHVLDTEGQLMQVLNVLYDPITADLVCGRDNLTAPPVEVPTGRFSGRAEFDVRSSESFNAAVMDAYGQLLCLDPLEVPPAPFRPGDSGGWLPPREGDAGN